MFLKPLEVVSLTMVLIVKLVLVKVPQTAGVQKLSKSSAKDLSTMVKTLRSVLVKVLSTHGQ